MSMPKIETPCKPISCKQAITDVIESIALEETGLSHIINAEGEKIQKALECTCDVDDLVKINKSVQKTLDKVANIQILLGNKLDTITKFGKHKCH